VTTPNSARSAARADALAYCQRAEREAARVTDIVGEVPSRLISTVGIVGAGTMGGGIAMNFLNAGIPVVLTESNQPALDRGLRTIRANYERSARRGKLTEADIEARMGKLEPSLQLASLADCDLVIEAVYENMVVKKALFAQLEQIVRPGAILATNTSYLDINEIAACTRRARDVIGLHFFSPANVMKLLEVVRGSATAPDVIATAMQLGKTIEKVPVLVGVCHGFVGNRMLTARRAQALELVDEGAMPWDVDRVLEQFGMPMGPFAMTDLAGLDIGWSSETSRGTTVLRDRLCELGRRGQKTGAGYYNYDPETRKRSIDPAVQQLVVEFTAKAGRPVRSISDTEILERCLYSAVNEGARILEEGIAMRASDIDVIWVNGYGWPAHYGGPMYWADGIGLKSILSSIEAYEQRLGEQWRPASLLRRLAARSACFTR
jgi:3-hydroxyacyl-CoA dehydrogenase